MSPLPLEPRTRNVAETDPRPPGSDALVLEAWAQGYMVGSLVVMIAITMANMRRGVRLHKLILIELVFGLWQGFWLFPQSSPNRRIDTWWLSVAAIPLNVSWILHNVVSWMKIKPFFSPLWNKVYIGTVVLSIPYWIVEVYANFAYFHYGNAIFNTTRPLELLFRDPWWIISTVYLFIVIKTQYDLKLKEIIRISPRFGIMLASMLVAIVFVICDVLSVTKAIKLASDMGINPFWKLAFVFKCLTDSVILDDFKIALDRLRAFKISRLGSFSGDHSDKRTPNASHQIKSWSDEEKAAKPRQGERRGSKALEEVEHSLDGPTPTNLDGARKFNLTKNSVEHIEYASPGYTVPTVIHPTRVNPAASEHLHWSDTFDLNAAPSSAAGEYAVAPNQQDEPQWPMPSPKTT
ncbi:unnamed protein product [Periconia digitata]|uniref:Uncharacterized protein n=1 Tax=Periconia digitata TaxID=1303443 RepID=A0A9W4UDI1_9PLEO|nr:unnamed protein product [Periconia digitata]